MENKNIIYYEQLESTNLRAEELAKEGAGHGTVVVAGHQTGGRGRRGRSWESPADENIYMSLLLKPEIAVEKAPMLTLVMAYSVTKALQIQGFTKTQIKWPNDLVLSGKKVCGILTEMSVTNQGIEYVIIGVGVNVNATSFSEELSDKATSLRLECGEELSCRIIVEEILQIFEKQYEQFVECGDLSFLCDEYNEILVNRDKEVCVLEPGHTYHAHAKGINALGELVVKTMEGEEKTVFAGEVSVRGIYGYV